MDLINNLLKNYYKKINQSQLDIEKIIEQIKKETNLTLTNQELRLKDGTIQLRTGSKKKIEILIKQEAIIKGLSNLEVRVKKIS